MDAKALWQRYQQWLYFHEGLGLYLDVSRMRFNDAFVEACSLKFKHAFTQMTELENGALATRMKIVWWATTGYETLI